MAAKRRPVEFAEGKKYLDEISSKREGRFEAVVGITVPDELERQAMVMVQVCGKSVLQEVNWAHFEAALSQMNHG